MQENTYQSRRSLLSDVSFLLMLIITGTAGVIWLSTLSNQDYYAITNKFSATSLLITNFAGIAMSFKVISKIVEQEISKRAKLMSSGIVALILMVALPLSMSYLAQYTMNHLHPVLQHFTVKD